MDDIIKISLVDTKWKKRVGLSEDGIYHIIMSERFDENLYSIMDAITFNKSIGKEIILNVKHNFLNKARKLYSGHSFNEPLRDYEKNYLIHSTSLKSFENIKRDNKLYSFNKLSDNFFRGQEPFGKFLGDPDTLRDYILFSSNKYTPEIVIASKEQGKLVQNYETKYKTGVRMYFDAKKMFDDKILLRDGLHYMVYKELPLEKYLICKVDSKKLGLAKECLINEFVDRADEFFSNYIN